MKNKIELITSIFKEYSKSKTMDKAQFIQRVKNQSNKKEIFTTFRTDKGNWSTILFKDYVDGLTDTWIKELVRYLHHPQLKVNTKFLLKLENKYFPKGIFDTEPIYFKDDAYVPDFIHELYQNLKKHTKISRKEFLNLIMENFDVNLKESTIKQYMK